MINRDCKNADNYVLSTVYYVLAILLISACGGKYESIKKLPIYGSREPVSKVNSNGETITDTLYHTIGDFSFIDQDSSQITAETFDNKIYVTDFFFTTCPSICPKMTAQMVRVYETFEYEDRFKILSHTIDPAYDSVAVLREYANNLGVNSATWHFVTGKKEDLFTMGKKNYMIAVVEDENVEGGFFHGGHFLLIDHNKHIRGIYDGTDSLDINELLTDIPILLNELENTQ
jgi:protein SCO1/2